MFSIALGHMPYSIVIHSTGTVVKSEEAPLHILTVKNESVQCLPIS